MLVAAALNAIAFSTLIVPSGEKSDAAVIRAMRAPATTGASIPICVAWRAVRALFFRIEAVTEMPRCAPASGQLTTWAQRP